MALEIVVLAETGAVVLVALSRPPIMLSCLSTHSRHVFSSSSRTPITHLVVTKRAGSSKSSKSSLPLNISTRFSSSSSQPKPAAHRAESYGKAKWIDHLVNAKQHQNRELTPKEKEAFLEQRKKRLEQLGTFPLHIFSFIYLLMTKYVDTSHLNGFF